MANSQTSVKKIYLSVIEDVIENCRNNFSDEGLGEEALEELKQLWESKLKNVKAIDMGIANEIWNPRMSSGGGFSVKELVDTRGPSSHSTETDDTQLVTDNVKIETGSTSSNSGTPLPAGPSVSPDIGRMVPIKITLPAPDKDKGGKARILHIQVPAIALEGQNLHNILSGPVMTATLSLPTNVACQLLQKHILAAFQGQAQAQTGANNEQDFIRMVPFGQFDGANNSSDDNDSTDSDSDSTDNADNSDEDISIEDGDPLNSGDDVSEDEEDYSQDQEDTDNVVVCQFEKVSRSRNKWKFNLKSGIMNLNGKDYVFQKATGNAEW